MAILAAVLYGISAPVSKLILKEIAPILMGSAIISGGRIWYVPYQQYKKNRSYRADRG